jgi:amino acid transporter
MDVTKRVGGIYLFQAMALLLVVAMFGAALNCQVGGARLLFGMGRDNVLPRKVFSYLSPKRNTPDVNIWIIGLLAFFGSLFMSYELTAHLINFGAFLGFMGVNFAAFWQFFIKKHSEYKRRITIDLLFPLIGFLFCFGIWWGLAPIAKIAGGFWFIIGLIYLFIKTRGFRGKMIVMNFSEV